MAEEYEVSALFTADVSEYQAAADQVEAANAQIAGSSSAMGEVIGQSGAGVATNMEQVGAAAKNTGGIFMGATDSVKGTGEVLYTLTEAAVTSTKSIGEFSGSGAEAAAEMGAMAITFPEASEVVESMGASMDSVTASTEGASGGFLQTAWAMGQTVQSAVWMISSFVMVGTVVANVVGSMIDSVESTQKTSEAFTALTGSSGAASDTLTQLDATARQFNLPTKQVDAAGQSLLAMGVSAQDTTKDVATVSLGLAEMGDVSGTSLPKAAQAFATLGTQSHVTTQDIQNVANTGIAAWQDLASGMGVSVDTAMQRVKEGTVTGQQAMQDMAQGIQNNSAQASASMDSLQAHWNNFTNTLQSSSGGAGTAFDMLAKGALDLGSGVVTVTSNFMDLYPVFYPINAAMTVGQANADAWGSSLRVAGSVADQTGGQIGSMGMFLDAGSSQAQALGGSLGQASAVMEGASNSAGQAGGSMGTLSTHFTQANSNAATASGSLGQASAVMEGLGNQAMQAGGGMNALSTAFDQSASSGGGLMGVLEQIGNALGNIGSAFSFPGVTSMPGFSTTMQNIGSIPGFASGTDSAPGGLAYLAEDGPEIVNLPRGASVTPLSQLGGTGGLSSLQGAAIGGGPVTIQVMMDGAMIAQAIAPQFAPLIRVTLGRRA